MLHSPPKTIEDFVYKYLETGPQVVVSLIERIKKDRPETTKQGVYAALRELKKKNVVVVHGKKVSLNSSWFNAMSEYFSRVQLYYTKTQSAQNDFLNLKEGERIEYRFRDPVTTDTFWGHAQNLLVEILPSSTPVYIYDPHYWFLLARPETEKPLIEFILSKGHRYLMLVGGKTALDTAAAKEFDRVRSRYVMLEKPLFKNPNYYVSVIGDFITEAWLDKDITTVIEHIYETKTDPKEARADLLKAVTYKGRTRFVISKNARKAEKLKKLIGKHFLPM